jgi:hypothetical protein
MHWPEYVIEIDGKVEWNTFVASVTMSLDTFWNSSSKVWSFLCLQTNIFFERTHQLHGTQVTFSSHKNMKNITIDVPPFFLIFVSTFTSIPSLKIIRFLLTATDMSIKAKISNDVLIQKNLDLSFLDASFHGSTIQ